jgi:hypothetical protein
MDYIMHEKIGNQEINIHISSDKDKNLTKNIGISNALNEDNNNITFQDFILIIIYSLIFSRWILLFRTWPSERPF